VRARGREEREGQTLVVLHLGTEKKGEKKRECCATSHALREPRVEPEKERGRLCCVAKTAATDRSLRSRETVIARWGGDLRDESSLSRGGAEKKEEATDGRRTSELDWVRKAIGTTKQARLASLPFLNNKGGNLRPFPTRRHGGRARNANRRLNSGAAQMESKSFCSCLLEPKSSTPGVGKIYREKRR